MENISLNFGMAVRTKKPFLARLRGYYRTPMYPGLEIFNPEVSKQGPLWLNGWDRTSFKSSWVMRQNLLRVWLGGGWQGRGVSVRIPWTDDPSDSAYNLFDRVMMSDIPRDGEDRYGHRSKTTQLMGAYAGLLKQYRERASR